MLSKIRQRSWEVGQSLAGDGMLLRLRNASIALVGAVAAVGLGLTLFISQLGFPAVFSGPIPDNPTKAGSVHNAIALTQGPALAPSSRAPGSQPPATALGHPHAAGQPGSGGDRGGADQIAVSPGAEESPAAQPPAASVPAPAPTTPTVEPSPSAPSPAPAPAVVESQPKSGAGGQPTGAPGGGSKQNAPSTVKATSDGSKSKGPQTSKSDGQTVSTAKPTSPSEKAGKDQSAAASPKPVAPPAPAPSGSTSPAAAKEAADSGK
jgi:hypothetical protein